MNPLFNTELNPPPPPFNNAVCEVVDFNDSTETGIVLVVENEFDAGLRCSVSTEGVRSTFQNEDLTEE